MERSLFEFFSDESNATAIDEIVRAHADFRQTLLTDFLVSLEKKLTAASRGATDIVMANKNIRGERPIGVKPARPYGESPDGLTVLISCYQAYVTEGNFKPWLGVYIDDPSLDGTKVHDVLSQAKIFVKPRQEDKWVVWEHLDYWPQPERPGWLSRLARNRESFADKIVRDLLDRAAAVFRVLSQSNVQLKK